MADILAGLYTRRGKNFEAMKALVDDAETRDGSWSAEDETSYDKMNDELSKIDGRIKDITDHEARQKAVDEARTEYDKGLVEVAKKRNDRGSADDAEKRVLTWARAQASGNEWTPRGVEFDITDTDKRAAMAAFESRTQSKLTTPAGGALVPIDFRRTLYEHMIENSAVRMLGATVLTTASGEAIQMPKTTAHGGAALVAELGVIPASDAVFGQVTLDAFKYGKLTQVSSELLTDSAINLLDYLARDTGRAIGNASGAHFINGTGAGQPNGIVTAAPVGVTGPVGTSTSLGSQGTANQGGDALLNLVYSVLQPYRAKGAFLMNDASVKIVRTLKEGSTNQYLFQPGLSSGAPDSVFGYPIVTDPNMPVMAANAKSIVFGDFSAYYIRDVQGLRYERSDDFAFNQDMVTFRGLLRTDGDLIDLTALKIWQNSAT